MRKRVGVITLLFFATLDALLAALNLQQIFEHTPLLAVLNFIFQSAALFIVAYISAQSYVRSGLLRFILIGCSMIAFGIGNLINSINLLIAASDWANFAVTMHNLGLLAFSMLNFSAAMVITYGKPIHIANKADPRLITESYCITGALMTILGLLIILDVVPHFMVPDGFSSLRQTILVAAITLFTASSILLGRLYFESKSTVLYWYSLALALYAVGVAAITLSALGTPLSWAARSTQYAGSVFFLVAILSRFPTSLVNGWAEAFKRDRRQFDLLFANMSDGFAYHRVVYDEAGEPVDYVFLEVNEAFGHITGLRKEAVMGRRATEVLPGIEKDPADWIGVYGRLAAGGKPIRFENYSQALRRWYSVSAYCPEKGYFVTIFEDATERRRRREERTRERETLRGVMENAGVMLAYFDLEFNFVAVNSAYAKGSGRTVEELLGNNHFDLFPDAENKAIFQHVRDTGEPVIYRDKEFTFANQSEHSATYWDWTLAPVKGGEGRVKGLVLSLSETTQKKQMEDGIRSIAKFPSENPYPIMRMSEDGTLLYCNTAGSWLLNEWNCSIGKSAPEHWRRLVFDVLHSKAQREVEETHGDKTFAFTFVPIIDSGYVNVYGRDITERKQIEERLEQYTKYLEKLVEEKTRQLMDSERLAAIGATAGMVGHDIRNPLQSIEGALFLVKEELDSLPESEAKKNMRELVEEIDAQKIYINKIVSDLQDYARPLKPELEDADVGALIRDSLSLITIPKEITLTVAVEEQMPLLRVDSTMLKRVLTNLIINAVQAMPKGGNLTIQALKQKDSALISVKDTGTGIPEEVKPRLFQPLQTTKSKGQGLGLAVCKRLVEAHSGTISFESQTGKGTTFTIKLPCRTPQP